jgi:hypothetical protein
MKPGDKRTIEEWEAYLAELRAGTAIECDMDYAEREKRRLYLERHPLLWIREMFPTEAKYDFAPFQKAAVARILEHEENWYEVLSWSRELAKSTIVMFVVLFLILTERKRNVILSSNSHDNAVDLLEVYRGQLEANQRILFYYGAQKGVRWKEDYFITLKGASFRAVGAGQSPRGKKNKTFRSDLLLLDDFDTDEECRNPDTINQKWNWFEQALYFTRSFSEPLLTIWAGNVIAKDCCIVRAGEKAKELSRRPRPLGNWDIINIRMVNPGRPDPKEDFRHGHSVWPEKNSEEGIDTVLAQVSMSSAQKECFNNPVTQGAYFKEMRWDRVPAIRKFATIGLSVDKVLAMAKTITTIQISLPLNKTSISKTLIMKRHKTIERLFDENFWGTQ